MSTAYRTDVVAWAREQAALLRAGNFSALDIEHIADEVEDVGKSEQRELANRMSVLLAHLLKWWFQPERRGGSWRRTMREQRRMILRRLEQTPSLRADLVSEIWMQDVWSDAVAKAVDETGIGDFPEACPWSRDEILDAEFLPGDPN
jgi:hypothetical protein